MHARTKRLHSIMRRHSLTCADVAAIVEKSEMSVRIWRVAETPRVITKENLQKLVDWTKA